jgi:phage shock protein PspC (stress-responsive transcriptional regulator)
VAKTLYPQLEPNVLGMVQLLGSPVLAALEQNLIDDDMLAAPASWSSEVLDNPGVMMIGTTYDLEIVNGLAYLQQQGLIADGDTIGHIYIDGEYGGNGLKGSQYYAQQHDLTINEAKVTSTDNDLTGIVTGMRGRASGPSCSPPRPGRRRRAGGQPGPRPGRAGARQQPDVRPGPAAEPGRGRAGQPVRVGVERPVLLGQPKVQQVTAAYETANPDAPRNGGLVVGYVEGLVWQNVLTAACDGGRPLPRRGEDRADHPHLGRDRGTGRRARLQLAGRAAHPRRLHRPGRRGRRGRSDRGGPPVHGPGGRDLRGALPEPGLSAHTTPTPSRHRVRDGVGAFPEVGAAPGGHRGRHAEQRDHPRRPRTRRPLSTVRSTITLRRSRTDRMVAGVCGGAAVALGVEANLLRLGLVLLTVFGVGLGAVAYLAAWILVPETEV